MNTGTTVLTKANYYDYWKEWPGKTYEEVREQILLNKLYPKATEVEIVEVRMMRAERVVSQRVIQDAYPPIPEPLPPEAEQ